MQSAQTSEKHKKNEIDDIMATILSFVLMYDGSMTYRYPRINPQAEMYGLRFPQSNAGYLSDINPKIGFIHHGAATMPMDNVISTGVNLRVSIISKFIAIVPNDKQNPKVK
jgi:hypothetical protein